MGKVLLKTTAVMAIAAWFAPYAAHAQDAPATPQKPAQVSVAVTGGTLGIGPEVGFRPNALIGVRASAGFLGFSHDVDVDDINYHGDAKLKSYGANLDLYPFKNVFRISGGFRVDRNKINLVATPNKSVQVGNTTYTPDEIGTIDGDIHAKRFAPTLTLGVAKNRHRGLTWSFDAGVMFHGKPRAYDITATGELATNAAFQEDLEREKAKIQDKVDNYKIYPIAQVSIGWAF